jgi:hypothetical protein
MFKWPDPPDGQIVVRLPFKISWAVSGSITLTLGFGMLFWFGGLGWLLNWLGIFYYFQCVKINDFDYF